MIMIRPRHYPCLLLVVITGVFWTGLLFAAAPEKGSFLVANENIDDSRFRDRTILLIQHDAKGSAGLVVDRRSRLPVASVLGESSPLSKQNKLLSYGGPVEPQTLLALVKVKKHPPEPSDEVLPSLYVTGAFVLDEWPDFAEEVIVSRVFAGYAGWAPGQLDAEIKRNDWRVEPSDEEVIFGGGGGSKKPLNSGAAKQD